MIDNFTIKEVASYDKTGIRISLNKINYIFGTNGTGKTTISEFLRNSYHPKYSSCKIKWKPGSSNLDIYVYNRHFVNENFNVSNEIKGIFTLGKESTDIMKKIDNINEEIEKHREKLEILEINIEKKGREIEELQNNFMEQCWAIKQKYDTVFKEAFIGLRNNKRKFMERFLDEAANNKNNLYTYDELLKRVTSVFKSIKEKINPIQEVNYDLSLENHPIYKTKIIGKSDLDIGKLISELNISDWVRQGHKHLYKTNGKCPFCQQVLPTNFKEKLEKYFDETYTNQIKTLNEAIKNYKSELNDLIEKYNIMVKENNPFINKDKITSLLTLINSTFNENVQLLENKIKEPSISIRLKSLKEYFEQLDLEIKQVNLQIREHNRIIENIIDEKQKLINDIWRFLVDENKSYYNSYMENFSRENKALSGMKKKKEQKEHHKRKFEEEKIKLLNKLTSFLPSINEINNLLKSFGFTNFYLAESDKKGYYKIIRENGEDANETLSEGEKTFITFLYFYQLINGSNERTRVETPRIIVIDDPVSSLDSNVLFIVSSLINNIKQRIRENDHIFKQLIILTHNVYFHKEITFNKDYRKKKDENFWILRKEKNTSFITEYKENPIKNSYELLWKELKENLTSITAPNIMRRILENYFRFFGNLNIKKDIIDKFPPEEQYICNTLLLWVNDGSHHLNDDLYVNCSPDLNKIYFEIFKKIFIYSGHQAHLYMMLGENDYKMMEEETIVDFAMNEIQEGLIHAASGIEKVET